jgi:beta-lactamase family protein
VISVAFILLASFGIARGQTASPPQAPYAEAAAQLQRLAEYEVSEKQLPGLSIALVDDQKIVWAQGFGFADPEKKTAATAETVYRVGSVSKLFTDIAIMQLVERGQLDLDAPVTKIEGAAQVDIGNVDMPVLMWLLRLLETGSLARGLLFHRDSNPACFNTRQTLAGLTATTSASSIMNVSRR